MCFAGRRARLLRQGSAPHGRQISWLPSSHGPNPTTYTLGSVARQQQRSAGHPTPHTLHPTPYCCSSCCCLNCCCLNCCCLNCCCCWTCCHPVPCACSYRAVVRFACQQHYVRGIKSNSQGGSRLRTRVVSCGRCRPCRTAKGRGLGVKGLGCRPCGTAKGRGLGVKGLRV